MLFKHISSIIEASRFELLVWGILEPSKRFGETITTTALKDFKKFKLFIFCQRVHWSSEAAIMIGSYSNAGNRDHDRRK